MEKSLIKVIVESHNVLVQAADAEAREYPARIARACQEMAARKGKIVKLLDHDGGGECSFFPPFS
jgi:acetylornithine/succinyldiaminopimelate/putrescine aminotransferase